MHHTPYCPPCYYRHGCCHIHRCAFYIRRCLATHKCGERYISKYTQLSHTNIFHTLNHRHGCRYPYNPGVMHRFPRHKPMHAVSPSAIQPSWQTPQSLLPSLFKHLRLLSHPPLLSWHSSISTQLFSVRKPKVTHLRLDTSCDTFDAKLSRYLGYKNRNI